MDKIVPCFPKVGEGSSDETLAAAQGHMQNKIITVVLVDDHKMMRRGLRLLIEIEPDIRVVAEADDAQSAFERVKEHSPDVVMMDVHMPSENGLAAARKILAENSTIKIIILSSNPDPALVQEALEIGALGYVLKENGVEEVTRAIRTVMTGKLYLYPEATTVLMRNRQQKPQTTSGVGLQLSEREKQLLRLVTGGLRNKEIATQLKVTVKSVETYRARLLKKLKCASTAELICYAIREKIVVL